MRGFLVPPEPPGFLEPPMPDSGKMAEVAVGIGTEKRFLYRVPSQLEARIATGIRVLVPLGGRLVVGCVVGLSAETPALSLREVEEVLDDRPSLDAHLLQLTKEVARLSLSPWGQVIAAALPPLSRRRARWAYRLAPDHPSSPPRLSVVGRKVWEALQISYPSPVGLERLQRLIGVKDLLTELSRLRRKGWIWREMVPIRPRGVRGQVGSEPSPMSEDSPRGRTGQEGETVDLEPLLPYRRDPSFSVFLLFGGTRWQQRSYLLRLIAAFLAEDRGVLLLTPEIESATFWKEELGSRGVSRICLLHSGLSAREREEEWSSVQAGEGTLVIGTRSAVFAPHPRLGIIIIEDEHHPSFKQEEVPRYHAREVALIRSRLLGIPLVMASATPSLESFFRAERGDYHLIRLQEEENPCPTTISVVDMARETRRVGGSSFISAALRVAMEKRLFQGEEVALLVPRRGSFGYLFCRDCGFSFRCDRCDYPLVLHRAERKLLCHHCGEGREIPDICPSCRGLIIRCSAPGTQQVEEEVRRLFPEVSVTRLDRDTWPGRPRNGWRADGFRGGGRILVGTQMILKPSLLASASLIGILQADALLNLPDFRAGERLFSLVMEQRSLEKVSSLSLGGSYKREILLQTYNPDHYVFQALRSQDYLLLYRREMSTRRDLLLPPYVRLAHLEVWSAKEEKARRAARALCSLLVGEQGSSRSAGAAVASPLPRLRGNFGWRVVAKGEEELPERLARVLERFRNLPASSGVSLRADVDPIRLC